MATPNYNINYDDERFKTVESEKQTALNQINDTYNNMISQSDKFYQDQIDAAKDYAETQKQNQQANTDFAVEKIEQQKDQAHKDYIKEQTGAYVDWQKQSNQYGTNAEQMAASGLNNTGYSESSQVSMYNTYQNRVATARESFNKATSDYDNAIKEVTLQNNSAIAEILYNAYVKQAEIALQGFQYKNDLLQVQIQQQQNTEDRYYSRWQDVLEQMNKDNQLKESIRQYEQNLAYQKERDKIADAQWQKEYNLSVANANRKTTTTTTKTYEVNTPYYQGKKNSDCQYGTFSTKDSNGISYQPNNIGKDSNGKVKYLKSSGKTVGEMYGYGTLQGATGANIDNQTVWKYGKNYYIWDGSQNQYIKMN